MHCDDAFGFAELIMSEEITPVSSRTVDDMPDIPLLPVHQYTPAAARCAHLLKWAELQALNESFSSMFFTFRPSLTYSRLSCVEVVRECDEQLSRS